MFLNNFLFLLLLPYYLLVSYQKNNDYDAKIDPLFNLNFIYKSNQYKHILIFNRPYCVFINFNNKKKNKIFLIRKKERKRNMIKKITMKRKEKLVN